MISISADIFLVVTSIDIFKIGFPVKDWDQVIHSVFNGAIF